MGTHINIVLVVQLVGIGGKHSVHVEGIVLPPLQSEVDIHIAPRSYLSRHIVTHIDVKRIYQTDFLETCRVLIALDLHLQVVA